MNTSGPLTVWHTGTMLLRLKFRLAAPGIGLRDIVSWKAVIHSRRVVRRGPSAALYYWTVRGLFAPEQKFFDTYPYMRGWL